MWLLVVLSIILILLTTLVVYARWNYGVLEELGIPVVKTSFILGSTPDLQKKVAHFEDIERFKKYGSIYGVYEGRRPQIHIVDPALVREIFVKDFEHFYNRRDLDLGDPILNEILDFVPGEKWKRLRSELTPMFSGSKVKHMISLTEKVAQDFSNHLRSDILKNGGTLKIEARDQIACLVIDFLLQCSFGIKIGDAHDPNNFFVKNFKLLSGNDGDFGLLYNLSLTFPFLTKFSPTLDNSGSAPLAAALKEIMYKRMQDPSYSRTKLIDLADKLIEMLEMVNSSDPEYKRLGITENTVLAQAVGGFFLAAYDSIITVITMTLYYLAQNPQKQERLQQEVDSFFETHDESSESGVTLDSLNEMPYLWACIKETLRLVPPFIRPERVCTKDWTNGKLWIKKGMIVMLPAWAYHRNPQIYVNPEEFHPERYFGTVLDPYAFGTYGFGPRKCPGERFANEAMKMCLAHILKNFEFKVRSDTEVKFKPGVLFLVMYNPIYLDVTTRF